MNRIDLEGRAAIVTGAAQGFGLAITRRFLDSGARVAMWDVDGGELDQAATALPTERIMPLRVDVTDPEGVARAVDETVTAFGQVDILVNNAGIAGPTIPLHEYPVEEWRRIVELDLNAVFYCCRAVVPYMLKRNYGRIVNIASIAGKEGNPNAAAYASAKGGVIALTKALGKELAEHDIAVNCVTPAAARTRIFDQMTPKFIDMMLSKIPRGRFVETDEVAAMVAWIASEENRFTTGGVFDISGGRATY